MTRLFDGNIAEFDYTATRELTDNSGNPCYLVALDEFQIMLLLSAMRTTEWFSRWKNVDRDTQDKEVSELEFCLMSGCNVSDLITTNRMVVAALVGLQDDFSQPLPASVDFTETGIGARIAALEAKLEEVRALQESTSTTNEENIDDIEEILDGIGTILGAAAVLA